MLLSLWILSWYCAFFQGQFFFEQHLLFHQMEDLLNKYKVIFISIFEKEKEKRLCHIICRTCRRKVKNMNINRKYEYTLEKDFVGRRSETVSHTLDKHLLCAWPTGSYDIDHHHHHHHQHHPHHHNHAIDLECFRTIPDNCKGNVST